MRPDQRYRELTRCSRTMAWPPTRDPVASQPKDKPDEPLDFRGTPPAAVAGDPQGQHQYRGTAGTATGDSAVVAAPRAAAGDRSVDRRNDRRDGRHRDAAHLAADAVLPLRAAAGRHRVFPWGR